MPPRFRIFITLLLLTFCTLHAKSDATRIEFYYGIAEGNYLIGDLKGAANGVEQMLKIDADYVPALTLKTRIKIDQGEAASRTRIGRSRHLARTRNLRALAAQSTRAR